MVATTAAGILLAGAWRPDLIVTSMYLVVALLLGAAVIALVSRWRRRYGTERLNPSDQLTHFRSLYEKGQISAEEFARLRTLLTGQVQPTPDPKKPLTSVTPEPNAAPPANGQSSPEEGIRPA